MKKGARREKDGKLRYVKTTGSSPVVFVFICALGGGSDIEFRKSGKGGVCLQAKAWADAIRIGAIYAGTVMGAGFASGQEVVQFFVSFGRAGFAGILLATVLFAWLGYRLLELGHRLRATAYHQAIYYLCGRRVGLFLDWLTSAFLFAALAVMLSGMATVARDHVGLPYWPTLAAAALAVAAAVIGGLRGIAAANMVLAPLLLTAVVAMSLYSLVYHAFDPANLAVPATPVQQPAAHWLLASLLYVSYNIVVSSTVLVPLGHRVPLYASRLVGGVLGGVVLGGLAAFLSLVVMLHYPGSLSREVPILEVASAQHPLAGAIYALILLSAMYTTALAALFGCAGKTAAATGLPPTAAAVLVTAAALACGQVGFAKLIGILFPFFGYATLWFTARLAWSSLRDSQWR